MNRRRMTPDPQAAPAPETGATDAAREQRGRLVRETWVAYCLATGDTKPSHIAPWEELSEWDKEADRRIGDAFAAAVPDAETMAAVEFAKTVIQYTIDLSGDGDESASESLQEALHYVPADEGYQSHLARLTAWLEAHE